MAEGEPAQERTQRRRRPDPVEQAAHPAMPQQVHIGDRVRPGDHPGHQRRNLQPSRVPGPARNRQLTISQRPKSGPLGQPQRRDQPGTRHQIRIIEDR